MRLLNKIGDWIVAKPHRYWLTQYLLYTIVFLAACYTVASIIVLMTR